MVFSAVENALRTWLKSAVLAQAGVAIEVVWANQDGPQPRMPYATVHLDGPHNIGASLPESDTSYDSGAAVGQEIIFATREHHELTLRCQAFTETVTGDASARALLHSASASLGLPSVRDTLAASGLAVIEAGDTQDLSALLETKWQGRAALDVRFRIADVHQERAGYIATATLVDATTK